MQTRPESLSPAGEPFDLTRPLPPVAPKATVALVSGDDRAANIRQALDLVAADFAATVKGRQRIVIKPNFVSFRQPAATTHVDAVRAVLETLQPLVGDQLVTIAESNVMEGVKRHGYDRLLALGNVRFVEIDEDDEVAARVVGAEGTQIVKLSRTLVESDCIISVHPPKTHDAVIVTLGLKNIQFTALMRSREKQYREAMHITRGVHHQGIYELAHLLHPHFSVVDGWVGMEGAGPVDGEPVEWRIALAGRDFLAVDVLTTALMGFNPADVGYLHFCKEDGTLGEGDLHRIGIVGEDFNRVQRKFRPHPTYEWQMGWKEFFGLR